MLYIIICYTDVPCTCPQPPSYGHTSPCPGNVSTGYKVRYYCSNNYHLAGDQSRTCQGNGIWTGGDPSCAQGGVG